MKLIVRHNAAVDLSFKKSYLSLFFIHTASLFPISKQSSYHLVKLNFTAPLQRSYHKTRPIIKQQILIKNQTKFN